MSHVPPEQIPGRIRAVVQRVDDAARAAGREPREVTPLLAVKTRTDTEIRTALRSLSEALTARGEETPRLLLGHNRVQEMVSGGPGLDRTEHPDLPAHEMHLIGPLQTNKINQALRWCDSIDSVHCVELADRIDAALTRNHPGRTLDVLIQVNTSGEETKSGAAPQEADALVAHVAALPTLRLRGFMTIGAHTTDEAAVRRSFTLLTDLRDRTLASGIAGTENARELSMGMSADLETAVACGATVVRLGTAVFGPRPAA